MLALFIALLAAAWLTAAQDATGANSRRSTYTVHAAVVFTRTGERTPWLNNNERSQITSLGAHQAFTAGEALRKHYITGDGDNLSSAHIKGLSPYIIDNGELYIAATEEQYTIASAEAFLQALYPPVTVNMSTANMLDSSSILSNSTYLEYPMGGYQYPKIRSAGILDPNSIYLSGSSACVNHAVSGADYYTSPEFKAMQMASGSLYERVGEAALPQTLFPDNSWNYGNAYPIYDFLSYQFNHDKRTYDILTGATNASMAGAFRQLRLLADKHLWALYGNLSASAVTPGDQIRAIAGKTLAAKVLGLLNNVVTKKGNGPILSLMFGEFQPLLSFFALSKLNMHRSDFAGLPQWGSSAVFELFSYAGDGAFPDPEDLWIRFWFRNGTADDAEMRAYPLFGRGLSETDIPFETFLEEMLRIQISSAGDWCEECGAYSIWCPAYNEDTDALPAGSGRRSREAGMTPQVAGVIGAAVTLGVLGLAVAAAMLFAGVRFRRVGRSKKSELGGFKGSRKLASDADLTLPKGGAGITVTPSPAGKERVGSWELRTKEENRFGSLGKDVDVRDRKPSFDADDIAVTPFADPVKPHERV
ncbi:hypothetical protein W97_00733 [Coniosporium apollinis CBS 100218]|uniref:Phosphoglycerate mutase-like protein n=1 Tax=Coniosporium apollinis (strain CBS 100218) TaxID=1168221 RepID=R7YI08_CONA1|nr:uncharacterized protein W97_00733 [Coniosporium apollinis CBS 100218]EON61518.1 hypothetical protein W97_00733 [Coniosporium apollinis CBS 100218]